MNRTNKIYANLAVLHWVALTLALIFYSCENSNQPTSHSNEAQISLNTVFITSFQRGAKGTLSKASSSVKKDERNELRLLNLTQAVDRVTVTVINSDNQTVVDEDLSIVQTAQGKFAEGTLSIPVNGDQETFLIDVKAFENDNLAFAGNTQITLFPEQVLTEPLIVTLQPLGGGDVQVTLTWNTATDQDLHVIDPSNTRIYFDNPSSPTGGTLDFDDTDGFGPENIFWPTGQAPSGSYKVQVVYFSGSGVTRVTVVVQRSDAPSQTFTRTINAEGDTLDVTEFNFTAGEPVFVSIAITPTNPSVNIDETVAFSATATASDGSTTNVTNQVTWASSDPTVASITTGGLATGLKEGSTTISATQGNLSDETTLTVNAPQLQSIDVTPKDQAIDIDQTQQFTATGTFSDGSTSNVTAQVTWASSDPTVASITTGGLATGLKEGSTTISATQGNIGGETTLTVNAPQLSGATLSNLQAPLVQANDSTRCTFPDQRVGSLFNLSFDYTDADGDVTQGTVVTVAFTFAGGGSGSFDATSPGITGDGFSGTLSVGACFIFGDPVNTSVTLSVTVTDAGGSVSNTISTEVQRPDGGNSRPDAVANKLGILLKPRIAVCSQR